MCRSLALGAQVPIRRIPSITLGSHVEVILQVASTIRYMYPTVRINMIGRIVIHQDLVYDPLRRQAYYFLGRMASVVSETVAWGHRHQLYEETVPEGTERSKVPFEEWCSASEDKGEEVVANNAGPLWIHVARCKAVRGSYSENSHHSTRAAAQAHAMVSAHGWCITFIV